MRDDVKIGVAIGVVLVVGLLLYFMFSGPSEEEPVDDKLAETGVRVNTGTSGRTRTGGPAWEAINRDSGTAGRTGTGTTSGSRTAGTTGTTGTSGRRSTGTAGTGTTSGRRADPGAGPGITGTGTGRTTTGTTPAGTATSGTTPLPGGTTAGGSPRGTTGTATSTTTSPGAATGTTATTTPTGAPTGTTTSTTSTTSSSTARTTTAQTPKFYVVKEGDRGFWGISQTVYGDGRYYVLIEKANPDKKAERLQPGDKLVIPPLPTRASDAERRTEVLTGAPAGSTTYTVQEGDAGFWGISENVYGNGKYFHLIERANPGVDPTRLRVGQVIAIPPKTSATSGSSTSGATGGGTTGDGPSLSGDQRTYTVQSTDSAGLWGIAKSLYGDANLYPAIEAANPGLDSTQLTPGQKIVVPSKAEAQRMVGSTGSSPSTGGESGGSDAVVVEPSDGRPIFD